MAVLSEMFGEKDVRPIVIFQTHGSGGERLKEFDSVKLLEDESTILELKQMRNRKLKPDDKDLQKEMLELHPPRGYGFGDVLERIEKSRATVYSVIPTMRFVGISREEQLKRARISIEEWMRRAVQTSDLLWIGKAQREGQENELLSYIYEQSAMTQVATLSGGLTSFIERPKDAEKVYDDIFMVINNRYTIGYYSTNETRDGKPKSVKIEVRGHPEYKIIGRNGYVAPER
jgi:hypothetical protein